jgi:hypothetical protein
VAPEQQPEQLCGVQLATVVHVFAWQISEPGHAAHAAPPVPQASLVLPG